MPIRSLFEPRTVAIVGVSSASGSFQVGGRAVLTHLRAHGYPGDVHVVTRRGEPIDGVPAVRSIARLPEVPECVVVAVPAADVLDVVEQGLERGVRAFVIITSGFAEAGDEGRALQQRVAARLREAGASMLGPNTTGFINFHRRIALSSTSRLSGELPRAGGVGMVIQSGALGSGFLDQAVAEGIGLSHLVSTGNQAVSGLADCVAFLVDDPATRTIALYVEAFQDFARFIGVARQAHGAGKPIVLYKAGRHESGRQAAVGHTGSLLGGHDAFRAAAAQLALCVVEDVEDLLPTAAWLAGPAPRGDRFAVLTVSGGLGGAVADALGEVGARLPQPSADTVRRLREHIPGFQSVDNPVDCAGAPFRRPGGFRDCVDALLADPAFDALVIASTPIVEPWADDVVAAVQGVGADKATAIVWHGEVFNAPALAMLRDGGVTVFRRVAALAAAVAAALGRSHTDASRLLHEGDALRESAVTAPATPRALDEAESRCRLRALGIAVPEEAFVARDAMQQLAAQAASVGFPVTVKGIAEGVVHKSEIGLVAVGIPDAPSLIAVADRIGDSASAHGVELRGYLLAPTIAFELELFASVSLDPEFGPIMTFGAGGIYTEILHDVVSRLLPLSRQELRQMIESCRVAAILHGARGRPPLDIEALLDVLESLAATSPSLGRDFASLEINPVALGRVGDGAHVLDASVFV